MLRRRRPVPSVPEVLERLYVEERAVLADPGASHEARARVTLRKWRVLHRHLRRHPFQVSETPARAEQWRRVLDHVRRTVGEPEINDWVMMQRDVAANIAAGIHDLRPRKSGPCYALLMEFVRNRKRKALAVLRWTKGKNVPSRPSFPPRRQADAHHDP